MFDEALKKMQMRNSSKKRMRGLYLFRALVRKVIANMDWLVGDSEDAEEVDGEATTDLARLNRIMLRSHKTRNAARGMLSMAEKTIMLKDPTDRTEEEMRQVYSAIGGLTWFKHFPSFQKEVCQELASNTYFLYYQTGRTVIRQGQDPHGLYFILEGKVDIYVDAVDPFTETSAPMFVGNMEGGDVFGEVSLLHNLPRTATIITAADCNLLCLRKEDFDRILKSSLQKHWDERKAAMSAFPYFEGMDEVSVREFCILSKMETFATADTILGSGIGEPEFVHFVLSGEIQVMEPLKVAVKRSKGIIRYRLYECDMKMRPGEKLEAFALQALLMKAGSTFALGEERYGRTLVATEPTTCLLCPRYWILQHNKGQIWSRVVNFLNNHVPTSRELFDNFLEQRAWLRYRKSLFDDATRGLKRRTNTTIHDVPYSLRLKEHIQFDRPGYPMKMVFDAEGTQCRLHRTPSRETISVGVD